MVKKIFGALALLVAMGFTPLANAQDDGGRAAFSKATKYFEAEEFKGALPFFEQAYQQSGKRPATIFGLAQCLRAMGEYARAIVYFEEYLATDPDNAKEVHETLGLLKEIAERKKAERDAEAARIAKENAQREAEAEARRTAEREQSERERQRLESEVAKRAKEAAEAAVVENRAAPPPPPITAAAPAATEEDTGSIASSPIFWIVTGAAVVGGAIAFGVIASSQSSEYGGSVQTVLAPLGGHR